ncbi:MAG: hypothetical protein GY719_31830 [bacterium]|nr:hypothetical protein [bacterium]
MTRCNFVGSIRLARLSFALLSAALLTTYGCSEPETPPEEAPAEPLGHPVVVIGVDGMEWDVALPMLAAGELPNIARLMESGSFGKLGTLRPTYSPAIWNSVATGKSPDKHGIPHFAEGRGKERRLYTNIDRKTKALWNIFSDHDLKVHTVGWWTTFPVESINGTMVAQTNTEKQVWKGSIVAGVEGQVYPSEYQDKVFEIVADVDANLDAISREMFGELEHPHSRLTRRLWDNTLWAVRADTIYSRVARELAAEPSMDLMLVYFGGPDVVSHRFWRYMHPEEFDDPPPAEEVANFSNVIHDYYVWADTAIGDLLAAVPEPASVIVVSDHGMHGTNQTKVFVPEDAPMKINSGAHGDAPPGVIIAAGRYFKDVSPSALSWDSLVADDVTTIGSVYDLTPTILALKGMAIGSDMDGVVLETLFEEGFLAEHPPSFIRSHDTREWLAARPTQLFASEVEQERLEQLKALGYLP